MSNLVKYAVKSINLTKRYNNGVIGAQNINLEIEYGKVVGLLGPNGAGKSTTVKMLTTAIKPTEGFFSIAGWNGLTEQKQVRNSIGLVTQDFAVDWALTVRQHLLLFGELFRDNKTKTKALVDQLLEEFNLAHKADVKIIQLSGGQSRRVQLIRCMLANPRVLFVDEPTLGIDPKGVKKVLHYIKEMAKQGKTIVMASNEMDQVESVCDEVYFFNRSKIIDHGSVADFLNKYAGNEILRIKVQSEKEPSILKKLTDDGIDIKYESIESNLWELIFTVKKADLILPAIVHMIVENGMRIININIHAQTLKDVFENISAM